MTKIISGFPGIGKSYLTQTSDLVVSDSDSSKFDKQYFPENYIDHISLITKAGNYDYVLVSSHKEVRELLAKDHKYFLVYPDASLKEEYMERYRRRGSPQPFLDLMDKNFENFVAECKDFQHPNVTHVVLQKDETLKDVLSKF